MPGFIKDIGGSNRMRFTRPGTNPNNLNLDPNQVIFDSDTIGNLSVLDYGENVVTATGGTPFTTQLRSWNIGYAPMIIAQIKPALENNTWWSHQFPTTALPVAYISSSPTGVSCTISSSVGSNYSVNIRWTAFRFPI